MLEEGESIGRIARWLTEQGVATRTGKTGWNTATIWGMLRNPAYAGQAAYGKTPRPASRSGRRVRPASAGSAPPGLAREGRPEEWKPIAVPALVTEEQFALVQQRSERNSRFSPRNTRRPSLLQGILVCRECGYAYYRCSTRSKNGKLREYYRCSGTDGHRRPEGRVCENRPVRLTEIDELVWGRVLATARGPDTDPGRDRPAARRRSARRTPPPAAVTRSNATSPAPRTRCDACSTATKSSSITLEELRARTPELRKREATLQAPTRRARRRAARRRDLPQAHRNARRLPRPARPPTPRT